MKKQETNKILNAGKSAAKKPATQSKKAPAVTKAKTATQKTSAVKSKKTTGKSPSASKNSVKTAVSAKKTPAKPAATKKSTSTMVTAGKKPVTSKATTTAVKQSTTKSVNNLVTIEIRKHHDAKGGHPHIMVDVIDEQHVSVGITHDNKKGKNHPNIALEHNPLGENRQAYIRRQGTVDKEENYSSVKRTGQITVTDNTKVKQVADKAKAKTIKNTKK